MSTDINVSLFGPSGRGATMHVGADHLNEFLKTVDLKPETKTKSKVETKVETKKLKKPKLPRNHRVKEESLMAAGKEPMRMIVTIWGFDRSTLVCKYGTAIYRHESKDGAPSQVKLSKTDIVKIRRELNATAAARFVSKDALTFVFPRDVFIALTRAWIETEQANVRLSDQTKIKSSSNQLASLKEDHEERISEMKKNHRREIEVYEVYVDRVEAGEMKQDEFDAHKTQLKATLTKTKREFKKLEDAAKHQQTQDFNNHVMGKISELYKLISDTVWQMIKLRRTKDKQVKIDFLDAWYVNVMNLKNYLLITLLNSKVFQHDKSILRVVLIAMICAHTSIKSM